MKRALAWVVVGVVVVGVYRAASAWTNPWAVSALPNPVLANLPKAAPGCGEKCYD